MSDFQDRMDTIFYATGWRSPGLLEFVEGYRFGILRQLRQQKLSRLNGAGSGCKQIPKVKITSDFYQHYGNWGLVIIMVVIASWILYRYLAPKNWREWSRAGLVQAFIIALYAEMYGFPLTIYVLTGFFGIDLPLTSVTGHLWVTLLGYGKIGAIVEMVIGIGLVFLGISLLVEGWREIYYASREGRLAADGLYGVVRHPQYLGIFLAIFGQLIHWPTILTLALFPIIVWAYVRLARKEETTMIEKFGDEYREYQRRVPMFFPRWGEWRKLFGGAAWSAEERPS